MKTQLPQSISTIDEAKAFLTDLHNNLESFHPEDDALNIEWDQCPAPSREECLLLNKLMQDIYALPGNDGRHNSPLAFDPCQFLIIIAQNYNNTQLQEAVRGGKFDPDGDYTYCIERNADPYRKFWTMDIIKGDDIELSLVYWAEEDAESDAELLEHITNITEC